MATILQLGKSISEMSPEELYEHVRKIRASRRIPKGKVSTKTKSRKKAPTTKPVNPLDLVKQMSAADARALLDLLGG